MCFVGNLTVNTHWKFHYDDITVALFVNIKYTDVALLQAELHMQLNFGESSSNIYEDIVFTWSLVTACSNLNL